MATLCAVCSGRKKTNCVEIMFSPHTESWVRLRRECFRFFCGFLAPSAQFLDESWRLCGDCTAYDVAALDFFQNAFAYVVFVQQLAALTMATRDDVERLTRMEVSAISDMRRRCVGWGAWHVWGERAAASRSLVSCVFGRGLLVVCCVLLVVCCVLLCVVAGR